MTEFTLYGAMVSLGYLFLAITAFWALLRWLDRLAGLKFRERAVPILLRSPQSTAIYFGARIVAVAIVVSAVLS